jgi:hypothetical protein
MTIQKSIKLSKQIEYAICRKIERSERPAKRKQVIALAKIFKVNPDDFLILWIANKIMEVVKDEKELEGKALDIAKEDIKFK